MKLFGSGRCPEERDKYRYSGYLRVILRNLMRVPWFYRNEFTDESKNVKVNWFVVVFEFTIFA